jgi:T5orf172 domain.
MPGLLKIGYTTKSPLGRAEELSSSSGVPEPFSVLFYIETKNPYQLEQSIHEELYRKRPNDLREFFRISDEELYEIFNKIDLYDGLLMQSTFYQGILMERRFSESKSISRAKVEEE